MQPQRPKPMPLCDVPASVLCFGRWQSCCQLYLHEEPFCLVRQVELFKSWDLRPEVLALHESHDDESCRPLGCKHDLQA